MTTPCEPTFEDF